MENFDDLFAPQPDQRKDSPFDKEAWAAKKQQERDNVYAMIDRHAIEMSGEGGLFRAYLDVQARFDRYSVGNAILVAAQCPDATKLADFDSWKASGVYVKRGADAITILEPGREYKKDDGSVGVSYNVKKVFDISQTSSTQQTAPQAALDGRLLLKALMYNAPCRFAISNELPEGVNAAYHDKENTIQVRQGLDAPTIFRGVAQELARAHMAKGNYPCQNPDFVAYSASYMLCQRSGVSVEGFSFDRMPEEYSQMDAQAIRGEVGTIREIAGTISADMNRLFAVQEKAQSVVARSTSLASPQAAKLTRSAAPPSPTEPASLGFGGDPNRDGGAR